MKKEKSDKIHSKWNLSEESRYIKVKPANFYMSLNKIGAMLWAGDEVLLTLNAE